MTSFRPWIPLVRPRGRSPWMPRGISLSRVPAGGANPLGDVVLESPGIKTLAAAFTGASLFTDNDVSGTTALDGGSVVTTGTQEYDDITILGADTTPLTTTNSNITFGSTLNSAGPTPEALTVSSGAGAITLSGTVGGEPPRGRCPDDLKRGGHCLSDVHSLVAGPPCGWRCDPDGHGRDDHHRCNFGDDRSRIRVSLNSPGTILDPGVELGTAFPLRTRTTSPLRRPRPRRAS